MHERFIENMQNHLLAFGYRKIDAPYGQPIFTQLDAGILYVVRIVEFVSPDAHKTVYNPKITDLYKNAFMVNIFLLSENTETFIDFINQAEEFTGQQIYEINWGIKLEENALHFHCSNKQPDKILNLRALINQSAENAISGERISAPKALAPISKPVLSYTTIILCGIYLAIIELNGSSNDSHILIQFGGLFRPLLADEPYRFFTSMFMHAGLMHFISNALMLFIVGTRAEKYFGSVKFIIIYLLSGLLGSLLWLLFTDGMLAVGASGAASGALGALLAMIVKTGKPVDGFTKLFTLLFSIAGIGFSAFFPNVANIAHIGGFASGFVLGWIMAPKK